MKRYPWEWLMRTNFLYEMTGRCIHKAIPPALAERLLRRAGRCPDAGCTGSAEKCAKCCGRGGGR